MKSNVLVLLLIAALIGSVTSHRHLRTETGSQRLAGRELSEDAIERQRILAELEEVHQLRERMLQEGEHFASPARQLLTAVACALSLHQPHAWPEIPCTIRQSTHTCSHSQAVVNTLCWHRR